MACLIVPGLHSSGPQHWQSRWERERRDCRRVELGAWDDPTRTAWIARLATAIEHADGHPVLVAHSLGCLAVVWWARVARRSAQKVAGALLVAPPDVERDGADPRLGRFAPIPRGAMPFPTILVASRNDPYASFPTLRGLAACWAARLHDAGEVGHINADSGLGSWDQGQSLLGELIRRDTVSGRRPATRQPGARG